MSEKLDSIITEANHLTVEDLEELRDFCDALIEALEEEGK